MKDIRVLLAHFSPTGTTLKVARSIATGMAYPVCEVDLSALTESMSVQDGDILLAAMPVYGGRVPTVALERLAQIKGQNSLPCPLSFMATAPMMTRCWN